MPKVTIKMASKQNTSNGSTRESSRINRKLKADARFLEMFEKVKKYFVKGTTRKFIAEKLDIGSDTAARYLEEWECRGWVCNPMFGHKWYLEKEEANGN
jgi:hypothetical protein